MALHTTAIIFTVHLFTRSFNLATRQYTTVTNEDLDIAVQAVMMQNRRIGANAVLNNGVHVQRERVRQSIRRGDPAGVALRSARVVKRICCNVAGPNIYGIWIEIIINKVCSYRQLMHFSVLEL